MFGWLKDREPDDWTPDRQRRVRLLDHVNGDVEAARAADLLRSRLQFVTYLVDTGRLGQGDDDRA